jgi:hypothetical protein
MDTFMRQVNDVLMPRGPVWEPAYNGRMDRLLDGFARNSQEVFDDLEGLAYIRNPYKVPARMLTDLEREFGVTPDNTVLDSDRREALAVIRYSPRPSPRVGSLQNSLDKAGFGANGYGLTITPNGSPASDPHPIVNDNFLLTAHEYPSRYGAGTASAYAAERGGYYLVNGDRFNSRPVYPQAGNMAAREFPSSSCAGYYEGYAGYENEYTAAIPEEYWPFVFFCGGTVTRNEDGSIASVATVNVPISRRQELHRIILRQKPLHSWAGMLVNYV